MDFKPYVENTRKTALYPQESAIDYVVLGLAGEIGEICNKVKKIIRDNNNEINETVKDKLKQEMGDCCWYLARTIDELTQGVPDPDAYKFSSVWDGNYNCLSVIPKDDIVPYTFFMYKLSSDVVDIALHTYHAKSNDNKSEFKRIGRINRIYTVALEKLFHLMEIMGFVANTFLDSSFEELCDLNIEKLFSRKERGVIKGDGDNR